VPVTSRPVSPALPTDEPARAWPSVRVLGFRLDLVGLEQAAQRIVAAAAEEKSSENAVVSSAPAFLAVSFNPELVMRAQKDPAAAEALLNADLCYPDGVGAVWAARRELARLGRAAEGAAAPERVAGVDLAQRVLELAAAEGLPVYFLGAAEGVATEAARRQAERVPGLRIAGCHHGYYSPADEADVVRGVRESGAHILLAALGAPRQEILLYGRRSELGVAAALGVGGSFDVWAGKAKRAPACVQRGKVEWLYRLVRQPSRLRRQMALVRYAAQVLRGRSPQLRRSGGSAE
jgi:N-acetylglucosaminyldiphosphoundecaprenol N-acetyl-beta-D-mannosaminyltransferase